MHVLELHVQHLKDQERRRAKFRAEMDKGDGDGHGSSRAAAAAAATAAAVSDELAGRPIIDGQPVLTIFSPHSLLTFCRTNSCAI